MFSRRKTPDHSIDDSSSFQRDSAVADSASIESDLAAIGLGLDQLAQMNSAELVTAAETAHRVAPTLGGVVLGIQNQRIGYELDQAARLDDAAQALRAKIGNANGSAEKIEAVAEMFRAGHRLIADDREKASSMLNFAGTAFQAISQS